MIKVSLKEAEGQLSELIEEAAAGQEVVITKAQSHRAGGFQDVRKSLRGPQDALQDAQGVDQLLVEAGEMGDDLAPASRGVAFWSGVFLEMEEGVPASAGEAAAARSASVRSLQIAAGRCDGKNRGWGGERVQSLSWSRKRTSPAS